MSHFPVLVCLPADTDLTKLEETLSDVMQPWDEGRDVEPYRDYEEGSPENYWWVNAVRRGAEHHRDGTEVLPHYPDDPYGLRTRGRTSKYPEDVQRAEFADDALWAERLGDSPTWETVVQLHNEKWHLRTTVAVQGDDSDDDRLHYDAESGRAYKMTSYNPQSKWDYWRIGGRWVDYFIAKERTAGLVWGNRDWDSAKSAHADGRVHCDGGPIQALDFEAMRDEKAAEADARYDRYEALLAQHGHALGWSHFTGLVDVGEMSIEDARREYHKQPLIEAVQRLERTDEWLVGWGDCVVEEFLPPREDYVAEARRGAVPGYALVSLAREWIAPGRMGWFGMSSDGPGERSGYRYAVNTYLDQLDPATFVVVLDCHI